MIDKQKIFSNPIIEDENDPFASNKISKNNELKAFAENLESLINKELDKPKKELDKPKKDGLIISIYADWGLGKTTFVDMWGQSLISKDIVALKFNAWKCDHSNEPILPFMAEIKSQFNLYPEIAKKESFFKAIKDVAGKILSSASISIAGVSLDVGGLFVCLEQKKYVIDEFKKELKAVVDERPEKKLYIFIDELDRCNPLFAIKLLEIAKHLFDVAGICFILSINHDSLKSVIKKVYGLEDKQASEYLERFFDFQFRLPEPDKAKYAGINFDDAVICNLLNPTNSSDINKQFENKALELARKVFISCSSMKLFDFSLRKIEKQANEIKVFLDIYDEKHVPKVFIPIAVYLLCLKKNDYTAKEKIISEKIKPKLDNNEDKKIFNLLERIIFAFEKQESTDAVIRNLYDTLNSRTENKEVEREIYDYFFDKSGGTGIVPVEYYQDGFSQIGARFEYERAKKIYDNFFNMLNFIHKIEVETTT